MENQICFRTKMWQKGDNDMCLLNGRIYKIESNNDLPCWYQPCLIGIWQFLLGDKRTCLSLKDYQLRPRFFMNANPSYLGVVNTNFGVQILHTSNHHIHVRCLKLKNVWFKFIWAFMACGADTRWYTFFTHFLNHHDMNFSRIIDPRTMT